MIFSFLPGHWNGKWHILSSTIPPIPQVRHMFYHKHRKRMAYPDPLAWLKSNCDISSSQSGWFLLALRKNYITADIKEPVKIILRRAIHSYRNTNIKLEREKISHLLACCWHLTHYIKFILSWRISLTLSRYFDVSE